MVRHYRNRRRGCKSARCPHGRMAACPLAGLRELPGNTRESLLSSAAHRAWHGSPWKVSILAQRWMHQIRTEAVPTISWRCARPRPPAPRHCRDACPRDWRRPPPATVRHRTSSNAVGQSAASHGLTPVRTPLHRSAMERLQRRFKVRLGVAGDGPPHADPATRCPAGMSGALPADGPTRDNPEMESLFGRFKVENRSLILDAESVEELRTIVGKRIRYYRGRVALTRFPGHLTPRSSSMASSRNRPANWSDHTDLLWFGATGRAPV